MAPSFMMATKLVANLLLLIALNTVGCTNQVPVPDTAISLPQSIGKRVVITGKAEPWMVGMAIRSPQLPKLVYILGLDYWPDQYLNQQVQVAGVLEERYDLPVFIADNVHDRMSQQGIPVPPGTDLHAASHRYVIRDAQWTLAQ